MMAAWPPPLTASPGPASPVTHIRSAQTVRRHHPSPRPAHPSTPKCASLWDGSRRSSWLTAPLAERRSTTAASHCYRAAMGIPLSEATLRLVDGKNYAVLATVNPDGSPQTSVVWVGRDGGDLLFSTVEGRVKHRNMLRDPRVSVTVIDSSNPENYVEVRGRVSMTPDTGRQIDTQLSWKYDGKDPDEDRPGAVRVVVRMAVEKTTGYAA